MGTEARGPRLPRLRGGERVLAVVFLVSLPLANPYIRGDGNGYYAYVRSLVIDGDLQFENEYRRGDLDFRLTTFRYADGHLRLPLNTATGHARNQWSVGPSLLWAPAFLQAHAVALGLGALGVPIEADGYSLPYRWFGAVATAFYGFLALLLAFRMATRLTGGPFALMATLAVWFASPLPMYMYFLPFYAHAAAAFTVSSFLWYWSSRRPLRAMREWALLGLLGGLAVLVYNVNGAVLLIALVEWIRGGWGAAGAPDRGRPQAWLSALARAAVFAGGVLAALLPQFVAKWIIHGSPFDTGRGNRFFFDSPRLWDVGFSSEHGLFSWNPMLLAAVAGLLVLARRDRFLGSSLLAAFGGFYYAVASYDRWHGVSGFGNRFFVSLTPIFVVGLAVLLQGAWGLLCRASPARGGRARQRLAAAALALPVVLLSAWNVGFMFQWAAGMVPRQGPVDFAAVARNQATVVPARMAGFALRYLSARDQVVREQEQRPKAPR